MIQDCWTAHKAEFIVDGILIAFVLSAFGLNWLFCKLKK